MEIPTYSLSYQFQESSKNYVSQLSSTVELLATLSNLMKAICSQIYISDSTHSVVDVSLLTTLSGLTTTELSSFNHATTYSNYSGMSSFIDELISLIDIETLGYYDGTEWYYVYYVQRLCSDSTLLSSPSTAHFYEYMPTISNPFIGITDCDNATAILANIYPEGYDDLYNGIFNDLSEIEQPFADWAAYCDTIKSAIIAQQSPRDAYLIKYLVLVSVYNQNTMSKIRRPF